MGLRSAVVFGVCASIWAAEPGAARTRTHRRTHIRDGAHTHSRTGAAAPSLAHTRDGRRLQGLPAACTDKTGGLITDLSGSIVLGGRRGDPGVEALPVGTECVWEWFIDSGYTLDLGWDWVDLAPDADCYPDGDTPVTAIQGLDSAGNPLRATACYIEPGGRRRLSRAHGGVRVRMLQKQGFDVADGAVGAVADDQGTDMSSGSSASSDYNQQPGPIPSRFNFTDAAWLQVSVGADPDGDAFGIAFSWQTFRTPPSPGPSSPQPSVSGQPSASVEPSLSQTATGTPAVPSSESAQPSAASDVPSPAATQSSSSTSSSSGRPSDGPSPDASALPSHSEPWTTPTQTAVNPNVTSSALPPSETPMVSRSVTASASHSASATHSASVDPPTRTPFAPSASPTFSPTSSATASASAAEPSTSSAPPSLVPSSATASPSRSSSSPALPSSTQSWPLPTQPPSRGPASATITVNGTAVWDLIHDIGTAASDELVAATGAQRYRFTVFEYRRRQLRIPPQLAFQVTPALDATANEPTATELVTAVLRQLSTPGSTLRQNQVFGAALPGSFGLVWESPANFSISPLSITFSANQGDSSVTPAFVDITVTNNGGASMILSSASIQVVSSPFGPAPLTLQWLSVRPPVVCAAGFSAPVLRIFSAPSAPLTGSGSAVALVVLEHTVINGPHAIPVVLTVKSAPQAPADAQDLFASPSFAIGAAFASGTLLLLCACACCVYVRCCRKRAPAQAAARPTAISGPTARPQQQSFLAFIFGWGGPQRPRQSVPSAPASTSSAAAARDVEITLSDSDEEGENVALSGAKVPRPDNRPIASAAGPPVVRSVEMTSISSGARSASQSASDAPPRDPAASPAGSVPTTITSGIVGAAAPQSPASLQLKSKPTLRASEFESKWATLNTVEIFGATLQHAPAENELEKALSEAGIACLASGTVSGVSKYYFYAQEEATNRLCMAEVSVTLSSLRMSAVIKAADATLGPPFAQTFKTAMRSLLVEGA